MESTSVTDIRATTSDAASRALARPRPNAYLASRGVARSPPACDQRCAAGDAGSTGRPCARRRDVTRRGGGEHVVRLGHARVRAPRSLTRRPLLGAPRSPAPPLTTRAPRLPEDWQGRGAAAGWPTTSGPITPLAEQQRALDRRAGMRRPRWFTSATPPMRSPQLAQKSESTSSCVLHRSASRSIPCKRLAPHLVQKRLPATQCVLQFPHSTNGAMFDRDGSSAGFAHTEERDEAYSRLLKNTRKLSGCSSMKMNTSKRPCAMIAAT